MNVQWLSIYLFSHFLCVDYAAIESLEEENQTLLNESDNRDEQLYNQKYGNSYQGNLHNPRNNKNQNDFMGEEKSNFSYHDNNNKNNGHRDGHKNGRYSNSPSKGYGAGDILIKSSKFVALCFDLSYYVVVMQCYLLDHIVPYWIKFFYIVLF